jgi:cytoskeletal protein CcmA (bactofilin family)
MFMRTAPGWTVLVVLCLCLPAGDAGAGAPDSDAVQRDLGSDHFAAGAAVRVTAPVSGDALLAGRSIDVLADVGGDLVATGADVQVDRAVKQGVYVAGRRISLNASVGRNVRAAGGRVELGPAARVDGNVSLAGGEVRVLGPIEGYLQVAGGRILIDAAVRGDVDVRGGTIDLGPAARVGGTLRYTSRNELKRDPAASVQGGITRVEEKGAWSHGRLTGFGRRGRWVWSIGIVIMAGVLAGALPGFAGRVGDTVRSRWGGTLLIGFIGFVCIPVIAFMLLLTIVGIPLALVVMMVYVLLLLVGYAASGVAVGEIALRRLAPERAGRLGWRIVATALAMGLVSLLGRTPGLGAFVVLAAVFTGVGALLLQVGRVRMTAVV